MKISIYILILFIHSFQVHSQDNNSLYNLCILDYLLEVNSHKRFYDPDTIYVLQKDFIENMEGDLDSLSYKTISPNEIFNKTKKGKSILIIDIRAVTINQDQAFISIVLFGVSRRRNHFSYINNESRKYELKYDCLSRRFIINKVAF